MVIKLAQLLLWRFLEALPLLQFLAYIHWAPPSNRGAWLAPYGLSFVTALIVSSFLLWKKHVLNSVFFAIHLYFASGLLALLAGLDCVNELYGRLESVAMIVWILLLPVLGLFLPCKYLSLINKRDKKSQGIFIAGAGLALVVAYAFRNIAWISELLVFVFLFSLHSVLSGGRSGSNV